MAFKTGMQKSLVTYKWSIKQGGQLTQGTGELWSYKTSGL